MNENSQKSIDIIIELEGGYVNNPNDPGGETKFGISKRAFPNVDIKNLTKEDAEQIYLTHYWENTPCESLAWPLCLYFFDCNVNQGPAAAITLLQKSLGVTQDGIFGTDTYNAVNNSNEDNWNKFMALRAQRYTNTVGYPLYGLGWFIRLFTLMSKISQVS